MSIDQEKAQKYICNGETMGTRFSAIFHCKHDIDEKTIGNALQNSVDQVDDQMSTWKQDSDLMELNACPAGKWQQIPDMLFEVLEMSGTVQQQSNGAFDIGIGEFVNAWGFGPQHDQPDADAIHNLVRNQPWPNGPTFELETSNRSVKRTSKHQLDTCGIAKGYGVDQLAKTLEAFDVSDYLVSIDGELRASGFAENNQPWVIGIEEPFANERKLDRRFELCNLAVATSGNYRHFFEIEGQKLSHTMDPSAGRPVKNDISSVTVFATSCALADAWATAIWVGGSSLAEQAKNEGWIKEAIIRL